jgi:hypothetical protein
VNKPASSSAVLSTRVKEAIKATSDSGRVSQKSGNFYVSDDFPISLANRRISELDVVSSSRAAKLSGNIKASAGPLYVATRKETSSIETRPDDCPVAPANVPTLAKCETCSYTQSAKFCTECGIFSACVYACMCVCVCVCMCVCVRVCV